MAGHWNDAYEREDLPWDIGGPEPLLVRAVHEGHLPAGRLLEIGCGIGHNARYLAEQGWHVLATDLSPAAVELARARGGAVDYQVLDIQSGPLPAGPFDAVFDRGCFHVFHEAAEQSRFAARVAELLRPGGVWLSLVGSTEGPARPHGPPRRSARDLARAIEPHLELTLLQRAQLHEPEPGWPAWVCLARRRDEPAQPSSTG